MRALGIEHGYYPVNDPWAAYEIDWIVEVFNEFWNKEKFYGRCIRGDPLNEEELASRLAHFENLSHQIEKKLASHGKDYLAGEKITIADFLIFSVYLSFCYNPSSN